MVGDFQLGGYGDRLRVEIDPCSFSNLCVDLFSVPPRRHLPLVPPVRGLQHGAPPRNRHHEEPQDGRFRDEEPARNPRPDPHQVRPEALRQVPRPVVRAPRSPPGSVPGALREREEGFLRERRGRGDEGLDEARVFEGAEVLRRDRGRGGGEAAEVSGGAQLRRAEVHEQGGAGGEARRGHTRG